MEFKFKTDPNPSVSGTSMNAPKGDGFNKSLMEPEQANVMSVSKPNNKKKSGVDKSVFSTSEQDVSGNSNFSK